MQSGWDFFIRWNRGRYSQMNGTKEEKRCVQKRGEVRTVKYTIEY